MDDERLDAAIDETVRRMTAGEPSAEFRHRVLTRISAGLPVPSSTSAVPRSVFWPGLAAVTAAALLLVTVILGRHPGRDSVAILRAPQGSPIVRAGQPHSSIPEQQTSPAAGGIDTVRQEPTPTVRSGNRKIETETRDPGTPKPEPVIPPLVIPPLDLDSIAVAALPHDTRIGVEPLPPLAPIAVVPLGAADQGAPR